MFGNEQDRWLMALHANTAFDQMGRPRRALPATALPTVRRSLIKSWQFFSSRGMPLVSAHAPSLPDGAKLSMRKYPKFWESRNTGARARRTGKHLRFAPKVFR